MGEVLKTTNSGHVRTLTLNRPEKKNALSSELAWAILAGVEEATKDDNVWVIAITGTGDAFCSGLDLTGAQAQDGSPLTPQEAVMDDLQWISRFPLVLREQCDKPIVAGINGVAVGGGLSLAMSADVRIMAKSARLIAGYPRIGGSPDGGLSWTLSQAIGYEGAMRFLLENRTVQSAEAQALGMVGEVVSDEQFPARFHEYCQTLTTLSPITARLTKRVVRRATGLVDPESHFRYEVANTLRAFGSQDGQEALAAFREKRPPSFEGR